MKQFFSEEKNQKTFIFDAIPDLSVISSAFPQAPEQKSFAFFFRKELFPYAFVVAILLLDTAAFSDASSARQ
jgi:hypothetical protein